MGTDFDYGDAFSRNFGWVTHADQTKLQGSRVAIAGLGGVGGAHLLTLARLGISKFNIADFDDFDVHNMNRQAGAFMPFMGKPKIDTMAQMAQDINPEIDLRLFAQGVQPDNVDEFLRDVDVDVGWAGLFWHCPPGAWCLPRAEPKGIPALTAAPLGMGTAFLYFSPTGMSFEDYFQGGRACHTRAIRPVHRRVVPRHAQSQLPGRPGGRQF